MGLFSHALWGIAIIRNRELRALAIGVSILPDIGTLPPIFEVLLTFNT